jgi:hypothetical protein
VERLRGPKTALAVIALVTLLALGGLAAAAMRPGAAPAAELADTTPPPPPPTTTVAPPATTVPAPSPDPAPAPAPKPKPVPKPPSPSPPTPAPHSTPAPAPVVHQPTAAVQTTPRVSPTYTPPVAQTSPPVAHRVKAKARHRVQRRQHVHPKPAAAPTLPTKTQKVNSAGIGAASVAATRAVDGNPWRPLIIVALCMALMLFAVAAAPVRVVPWRRAAYFVNDRHIDLTVVGVVLLVVAALTMLLTKG